MKKIAIFVNNLNVGGIQKSLVNMLNQFDYTKYKVDLYVFNDNFFYEVNKNVNIILMKKPLKLLNFVPYNLAKKIYIPKFNNKNYDVSIDFDSYQMHTAIGALKCDAKKKIIWVHNDIPIKLKEEFKYRILYFFFQKKYKFFDCYCAVSQGALDSFKKLKNFNNKKFYVVPNYIDTNEIREKLKEQNSLVVDMNKLNIVTVGRLVYQKGIDIMLENIQKLVQYRQDFHLYIIGDGPLKNTLQMQTENLKISEFVTFLGNQKNPFSYLNKMDLFYLSSRYEGQGMVILEALSVGLDVLIPKHLEKYCPIVKGSDNVLNALKRATKLKNKKFNDLKNYNDEITKTLNKILS